MQRKNFSIKRASLFIVSFSIFIILLMYANPYPLTTNPATGLYYERGRVVEIYEENTEGHFHYQVLIVDVLSGEFRGLSVEARNNLMDQRLRAFEVGDRVILELTDHFIQIHSPERGNTLFIAIAIFVLLLCIIGGKKGLLATLGLVFSLASIGLILIPLTLAGYSSILIALIVGILITVVTIVLLVGVNVKSISAIIGCVCGVIFAALFAFIVGHFSFTTGYHLEYAGFIRMIVDGEFPLSGIFVSGVIISALGAITDTAMSITSSMEEIHLANPEIEEKSLFRAGINVGRDIMGTMSNTLILAFVGSSLSMLLFNQAVEVSFIQFINNDGIAIEIIQGIAGSIGIILTVPITVFVSAKLMKNFHKN